MLPGRRAEQEGGAGTQGGGGGAGCWGLALGGKWDPACSCKEGAKRGAKANDRPALCLASQDGVSTAR